MTDPWDVVIGLLLSLATGAVSCVILREVRCWRLGPNRVAAAFAMVPLVLITLALFTGPAWRLATAELTATYVILDLIGAVAWIVAVVIQLRVLAVYRQAPDVERIGR